MDVRSITLHRKATFRIGRKKSTAIENAIGACVDDFAVPGGACFDFGSMMLRRPQKSAFEGSEVRCGDAPKR
jgi:hypothetical protein